ncbi:hypothetical protein Bca4012_011149 [Brassica carinata]
MVRCPLKLTLLSISHDNFDLWVNNVPMLNEDSGSHMFDSRWGRFALQKRTNIMALGCASHSTDPPGGSKAPQTTRSNQTPVSRLLRKPKRGQSLTSKKLNWGNSPGTQNETRTSNIPTNKSTMFNWNQRPTNKKAMS